jgi:predicted SnoaL-like aldol condensation-catalyzing enzyme
MKKADPAAGVEGDRSLADNEWVVRATIEEMKGSNIEKVGTTHDILRIKDGKVEWYWLPFMTE